MLHPFPSHFGGHCINVIKELTAGRIILRPKWKEEAIVEVNEDM
jgi:hypothetical protein